MGARDRIRKFLEENVGKVVTTHQIGEVAGISDYQRRIRELRNDEGMQIKTFHDRDDLKPDQYLLESLKRIPSIGRNISPKVRNEILERNGFTCQLCGAGAQDPDPINRSRTVRLHIDHIVPVSQGGTDNPTNLRVLCSTCNEGKSNIEIPSESAKNLLIRIRKASRSVQREVYEALKKRFEPDQS